MKTMRGGKPIGPEESQGVIMEIFRRHHLKPAPGQVWEAAQGVDKPRRTLPQDGVQVHCQGIEGEIPARQIPRQGGGPEFGQVQNLLLPHHPGGALGFIQEDIGPAQGVCQVPGQLQRLGRDRQVQVLGRPAQGQFPHRAAHQIDLERPGRGQPPQRHQRRPARQGSEALVQVVQENPGCHGSQGWGKLVA